MLCKHCGRPVSYDEMGLNKKLIRRDAEVFLPVLSVKKIDRQRRAAAGKNGRIQACGLPFIRTAGKGERVA